MKDSVTTEKEKNMMTCPRRIESGLDRDDSPLILSGSNKDEYQSSDDSCTYCGSLNPDTFMARVEKETVALCGTDKPYKVYVHNDGGEDFKQTYRDDDHPFQGYGNPIHNWITRPMDIHKFYFQHLSIDQRKRFVDLYNEKKLKFIDGGQFYVLPFFMVKAS